MYYKDLSHVMWWLGKPKIGWGNNRLEPKERLQFKAKDIQTVTHEAAHLALRSEGYLLAEFPLASGSSMFCSIQIIK
jgi:hypothetical protein